MSFRENIQANWTTLVDFAGDKSKYVVPTVPNYLGFINTERVTRLSAWYTMFQNFFYILMCWMLCGLNVAGFSWGSSLAFSIDCMINMIACGMMIYGLQMRKPEKLIPFLSIAPTMAVIFIFLAGYCLILMIITHDYVVDKSDLFMFMTIFLIYGVFYYAQFVFAYSVHKKLQEEDNCYWNMAMSDKKVSYDENGCSSTRRDLKD